MKHMIDVDDEVLRDYVDPLPPYLGHIRLAPIREQADLMERTGHDTLYACLHPWALRHRFISRETGDTIRARCGSWSCEYCGPRKTDQWRQLIAAAEPTLHIVLSRAGHTVEEAARALTTWVQYLRRGAKGRGKDHVGARPAYRIEYLAVLERHANFEETGFHWHLLITGIDYLPKDVLDAAWASATHGNNRFAWVDRVKNHKAIGYVTKYLTKELMNEEKGMKEREREVQVLRRDEEGNTVWETHTRKEMVVSHARRIRYSRGFFPCSTEELRRRLFSQLEDPAVIGKDDPACCTPADSMSEQEAASEEEEPQRSEWMLVEVEPFTDDLDEYARRRRKALLEALMQVRAGTFFLSGRVLSVWAFQRSQRRRAAASSAARRAAAAG